jgi:excisionase family DNA binding protein
MEGNERLLTVSELASWLGMSTPWVYKECEKGSLPFVRLGQALRFDRKEIEGYLQSRRNLKGGKNGN